jgi:hypothetical protein
MKVFKMIRKSMSTGVLCHPIKTSYRLSTILSKSKRD